MLLRGPRSTRSTVIKASVAGVSTASDAAAILQAIQVEMEAEFSAAWSAHWSGWTWPAKPAAEDVTATLDASRQHAILFADTLEPLYADGTKAGYLLGAQYVASRNEIVRERFGLPPRTGPLRKAALHVVRKGAEIDAVIFAGELELIDEAAVANVTRTGLLWFRGDDGTAYLDPAARAAISSAALGLIETGDAAAAGALLRSEAEKLYGIGEFSGRGDVYWSGVAEHAATMAGIRGQIEELEEVGWTTYELVNPMDERTTDICQHMNGKVFYVEDARTQLNAIDAATSVDELKEARPFSGKSSTVEDVLGRSLPIGSMILSRADSMALAEEGWLLPPFHFRCRTWVDIYYDPGSLRS